MPLKDIKTIQVAPEEGDETIRLWNSFGWEVKHKQRVKTQDVQKYTGQSADRSTSYYETEKGVDFLEFTFERDPERKNYAELVKLEEQYYAPLPPEPYAPAFTSAEPKRVGLLWIIIIVLGFMSVGGIPISIIVIVWRLLSYPKRLQKWEQAKEEFEENKSNLDAAYSEAKKAYDDAVKGKAEALIKAQSLV